jgi:hypothetical protein
MFRNDPSLEPGETALVAQRTMCGVGLRWTPGGDAEQYVSFVGVEHLALVDGAVYLRTADGGLHPHGMIGQDHIVVKPPAGQPLYVTPHTFVTGWASVEGDRELTVKLRLANEQVNDLVEQIAAQRVEIDDVRTQLAIQQDTVAMLLGPDETPLPDGVTTDGWSMTADGPLHPTQQEAIDAALANRDAVLGVTDLSRGPRPVGRPADEPGIIAHFPLSNFPLSNFDDDMAILTGTPAVATERTVSPAPSHQGDGSGSGPEVPQAAPTRTRKGAK